MWEGLTPAAAEQSLGFQARNPTPAPKPRAGFWSQLGEFAAAVPKGLGQGAQQTVRAVNRAGLAGPQAGNPLVMAPGEGEQLLEDSGVTRQRVDEDLRAGIEALRPDPLTSTTASVVLQNLSRVLGKVAGYTITGGRAGAVVGTGLDEGATGYLELRDKGVDPQTAAKAGAVRGASMALGVALPIAGSTVAQSVGLVAAGGPGSFMLEQSLTREILEAANYPELAAEYDPFDPVGVGIATLFSGAVGAAAHRARAKAGPGTSESPAAALADEPQVRDAAHVVYQTRAAELHMLGDAADPRARASHAAAVDVATRAMEAGEPVRIASLDVDPARAARVMNEVMQRVRALEPQMAAARAADALPDSSLRMPPPPEPLPVAAAAEPQSLVDRIADALGLRPERSGPADPIPEGARQPMQRAEEVARQRPDLLVRMDEGEQAMAAPDLVAQVREELRHDKTDAPAFQAAIECYIRTGG